MITIIQVVMLEEPRLVTAEAPIPVVLTGVWLLGAASDGVEEPNSSEEASCDTLPKIACVSALPPPLSPEDDAPEDDPLPPVKEELIFFTLKRFLKEGGGFQSPLPLTASYSPIRLQPNQ
jgi:hypothetical protein